MQVTFRLNLGTLDAERLGLDPAKCREGMTAKVSKAVGDQLVKRHIAVEDIKAVPPEPMKAVPPPADITTNQTAPPKPQGKAGSSQKE
jgi:hypothetical protein